MALTVQALARMAAYTTLLGTVVLAPHWIAYTLVPEYAYGAVGGLFPACITEDSTNCYWNAATMGNGQGNSFIDINGTAYYVR